MQTHLFCSRLAQFVAATFLPSFGSYFSLKKRQLCRCFYFCWYTFENHWLINTVTCIMINNCPSNWNLPDFRHNTPHKTASLFQSKQFKTRKIVSYFGVASPCTMIFNFQAKVHQDNQLLLVFEQTDCAKIDAAIICLEVTSLGKYLLHCSLETHYQLCLLLVRKPEMDNPI